MTLTVLGIGTTGGAWYSPLESIRPTESFPPAMLFTCQMVTEFVPPWTASKNCWVVTTFTDTVAGAIVTLIPVTGSVHVDVEVVVEVAEVVVVVQVTAVLVAACLQEARPKRAMSKTKNERRFTVPLSSLFEIPNSYGSVSTLILKM